MRTRLVSVVAAVCLATALWVPTRVEAAGRLRAGAIGLAPDPGDPAARGGAYSAQTLEDLRAGLLELADTVQDFALLGPPELADAAGLAEARAQIQQMPAATLNTFRRGIDPAKLQGRLVSVRAAVAEYARVRASASRSPRTESSGFPNASGLCTSANGSDVTRIPTSVVLAADVVWFVADGVREAAQDACKETAVVLGEGGNLSLACIPVDVIWIVAKAVDEGIHFCDDDLTGAIIDTNYARLAHIHTDLSAVETSVNGVSTQVTNLDTHVTNVDTHVAGEFTALDTHVASELAALDAHLTSLLGSVANQVANVQAGLDQANQRLMVLEAGQKQIMKLELTPEGRRQVLPAILTCTGSNCPDVLLGCAGGSCSWNNVGALP